MIIEKIVNNDIVLITSERWGIQLWTSGTTRKNTKCAVCRTDILKKERAFRPSTNVGNRADRIHEFCLAALLQKES